MKTTLWVWPEHKQGEQSRDPIPVLEDSEISKQDLGEEGKVKIFDFIPEVDQKVNEGDSDEEAKPDGSEEEDEYGAESRAPKAMITIIFPDCLFKVDISKGLEGFEI